MQFRRVERAVNTSDHSPPQVGDWHDTFIFPFYTPTTSDAIKLRFQPGKFTGYSVMHCQCVTCFAQLTRASSPTARPLDATATCSTRTPAA